MARLNRLSGPVLASLLASCSFQAPQLDAAVGVVDALFAPEFELPLGEDVTWIYELNGLQDMVFASMDEDGLLFVSPSGMRLFWDGRDLTWGRGLPNAVRWFEVTKFEDGRRFHFVETLDRLELSCGPQVLEGLSVNTPCEWTSSDDETFVVVQRFVNDERGLMKRIEVTLVPGADPLVLRRLDTVPGRR